MMADGHNGIWIRERDTVREKIEKYLISMFEENSLPVRVCKAGQGVGADSDDRFSGD